MKFIDTALQKLKDKGYKTTGPRMAVLEALAKQKHPLSAYQIEEVIPKNIPVNVVTIYRILELLESLGIVHKIMSRQGYVRCDAKDKLGCHHFAICEKCDGVTEYVEEKSHDSGSQVPKKLHFKSLRHMSEVTGLCEPCSKK